MKITKTTIPGAVVIRSERRKDERGGFARWFCEAGLEGVLDGAVIRQINHSHTKSKGTVRGMHFQHAPHAEKKIVRCLSGSILDVVVDLRCASPTFLQWDAVELTAGDDTALLIPEGCAHGFQALTDEVQMLYLHTAFYTPAAEGGVRYDDPRINIEWPLPVGFVSDRDRQHPLIQDDFPGVRT